MTESKHTPGPWSVDEDIRPGMEWNRHIYGPDGLAICFMAHSDGKATERDEANAALIASAPALAAEVERLRLKLMTAERGYEEAARAEVLYRDAEAMLSANESDLLKSLAAERRKVEALREALAAIAEGCSFPADAVQRAVRDRARAALAATEGGK